MTDLGAERPASGADWWDPFDAEFLLDPYPAYRRLRQAAPIVWHDQLDSWVITGFTMCEGILRDWRLFASDFGRAGEPTPGAAVSIQTLDPPGHTPLHRMLSEAVRAQNLRAIAVSARVQARTALNRLKAQGGGDFVAEVALPVSIEVALRLLGGPMAAKDRLMELSSAVVASMYSGLRPELAEPGMQARQELSDIIATWLESEAPKGVVGHLAAAQAFDHLPRTTLRNSVRVLLLAGINSTQRMLGLAALTLFNDQEAVARLRRTSCIERAVRELVRYDNPFQAQSRMCVEDVEVANTRLRAGSTVVLLLGAANRDPDAFPDPDRLDLGREPNRHLGFGRGTHACLGAPVALLALREMLHAGWREDTNLQLGGRPEFDANPTLRGLTRLPVRADARSSGRSTKT